MTRIALLVAMVCACSKTVAFTGEQTIKITGTPPAAPPAPTPDPPRVELRDNKIVINEKVQFAWDQATILPASFSLLDQVAQVINKNPHIKRLQVEGHASADGNARHNQELSDERARSVMRYLTDHGVVKDRLVSKGFGIDRPIADNNTPDGREANRRVEFNILEQTVTQRKVQIDNDGKEHVIEENNVSARTK